MRHVRLGRMFLQCASCRFSVLYFIPFCGGLAAAGAVTAVNLLLGAAFWCVLTLAIEVTNRLADRTEDRINRPERTALCERVGWRRLARAERLLWCLVGAAAAVWLALDPSWLLAGLLALGASAGAGYSRGPRIARRRLLVFVVLCGTFVGPFALGWTTGAADPRFAGLGEFVPLFWVMTLFIASLAGIKDVTDRAGDAAIGYRSAFVQLVERHGVATLALVTTVPYAALAAFVAAGSLPPRALALAALLPISLALALAVRGAGARARDQLVVREALYGHWLAFTSAALLLCDPGLPLLVAILAAWAGWLAASRWLHWGAALRPADLRRVARLARAGLARPVADVPLPASPSTERSAWATN